MIVNTPAVVLKSFDFRETSRIVTFFTKHHGKVKGILKGIRKDPRKFGSSVDKFTVNDIVFYQYRNSEIHLVSQCDLRQFYLPIRQDLRRSMAALYILELVDAIMPVEEENSAVYALLLNFFEALQIEADINKLVHVFQIKILVLSGFRPHLDSCLKCAQKIKTRARFSLKTGGLVCLTCKSDDQTLTLISQGAVASLIFIEQQPWSKIPLLKISDAIKKELKFVLNNFLVFHLEKRLKTEKYLSY